MARATRKEKTMSENNEQPSDSPLASPTCYAQRDLEKLRRYYFCHLNAMTREGLHDKSSISVELVTRDMIIDDLLSKHNAGSEAPR